MPVSIRDSLKQFMILYCAVPKRNLPCIYFVNELNWSSSIRNWNFQEGSRCLCLCDFVSNINHNQGHQISLYNWKL